MAYKPQNLTSHSSRAWKPWIRVPSWLGSGDSPLLVCRPLSFYPLMAESREEASYHPTLIRASFHSLGSAFMISANSNYFPKINLLMSSHWGLGYPQGETQIFSPYKWLHWNIEFHVVLSGSLSMAMGKNPVIFFGFSSFVAQVPLFLIPLIYLLRDQYLLEPKLQLLCLLCSYIVLCVSMSALPRAALEMCDFSAVLDFVPLDIKQPAFVGSWSMMTSMAGIMPLPLPSSWGSVLMTKTQS